MGKRITVHAGIAGVLLGLLVLLAGCTTVGDEAVAPVMSPEGETAGAEIKPDAALPVPDQPADEKDAAPTVAEKPEPAVELALRYVPGQTTTYKVTTEIERSVAWEGNIAKKPPAFRNGRTGQRVEVTFDQTVARVDSAGNAVVDVTIKALSCLGRARDKVVLDFDSSRGADQQRPLAKLIGQSYRVELTEKGAVLALIDIESARQAVQGSLPEHATALRLLSDKMITQRHEIPALMALDAAAVEPNGHWSSIRTVSFGLLGAKAYDRIYTLEGVEQSDDRRVAVVAMEAIPPAGGAEQSSPGPAANPFAAMSDNTDSYTGQLRVDLNVGQIEHYVEQFRVEWITVDPGSIQSGEADPAVLRMGALELRQLERIE